VRTRAFEGQGGMALSPDRRWLAYTSNVTGRNEIWVQPYGAAGAPVRVSPNGGYQPRWSPRGNELYYAETNRLMAVPIASRAAFEAGAPVMVFENRFWTLGSFFYDVHPDGRFLVIASGPYYGTSPINVVVNWTALLGANRFSR
jgi:hypothetical protein